MKKDIKSITVIVLLSVNIALTIGLAALLIVHTGTGKLEGRSALIHFTTAAKGKYTLYIGTNDKDTYKQRIPTDQARMIVDQICVKYVDGYTSQEACGGWVDETGKLTRENTLIYSFYGVKEKQLISVMNDILRKLNQNSILVEVQDANYAYFYGNK